MGFASATGEPRPVIRVLIADGAGPVRAAIADLLASEERLEIVAVSPDAAAAIEQARLEQPDVALLGVRMTGGGPEAARGIAAVSPRTQSIALSVDDDRSNMLEMFRAGAIGSVVERASAEELVEAIDRAARGQSSLPSRLIKDFLGELSVEPEQRFGVLIEHAPDAVVVSDRLGRIVLVNAEAERLFGYPRAELVGEPIELLLPERFRGGHAVHRDGFVSHPHRRPMGSGLELAGRRKDGTELFVDVSLSTVETPEGRLVAAFVRYDTSRQERVRRDRERAVLARVVSAGEEQRRQIAADIHDDSIQVMTAAGMRLQILRRSLDSPEQLQRLDDLEQSIRLSLARLRHLIFELRPPALDLEGLGAALRMYVEEGATESGAVYQIEDTLTVQPVEETRVIIYRIAQEVLANVRKHAAARRVDVAISDQAGGYHVRVTDDGVGFDPAALGRRHGHLGLAAIKERAELAGGWARVESAPGAGTTVEYWIARGDAAGGRPGAGAGEPGKP